MRVMTRASELAGFYGSAFVPTMGALHAGHAWLIQKAKETDRPVCVSIFVNPTQFGPNEDLSKYPRTLDADLNLCESLGVDVVFAPSVEEIYPPNLIVPIIEPGPLGHVLEGEIRPTHFQGVLTVVNRLFALVQPHIAVFGKKDRQQLTLIKKMVKDQSLNIQIIEGETQRESDGLALSSRNRYLGASARAVAGRLPKALYSALVQAEQGADASMIQLNTTDALGELADYCVVTDLDLTPVDSDYRGAAIILAAIRVEGVRLIDNMDLEISGPR